MVDQFDFTRTQMVLTMKLTSFAFSLYDGSCSDVDISRSSSSSENKNKTNLIENKLRKSNLLSSCNSEHKNFESEIIDSGNRSDKIDKCNESERNKEKIKDIQIIKAKQLKKILDSRTKYAITKLPTPLEFGGYVFCFPNLLAGPAFVYTDYIQGIVEVNIQVQVEDQDPSRDIKRIEKGKKIEIEEEKVKEEVKVEKDEEKKEVKLRFHVDDLSTATQDNKISISDLSSTSSSTFSSASTATVTATTTYSINNNGYMENSSVLSALHRLFLGLFCLILHFIISSQAPISRQYDPIWQNSHHFLYRMIYISISFLGERFKFYFAWKISEGACIMAGFGFEGHNNNKDGNKKENGNKDNNNDYKNENKSDNKNENDYENRNDKDNENVNVTFQKVISSDIKVKKDENLQYLKIVNDHDHDKVVSKKKSIFNMLCSILGCDKKGMWRGVENIDIISYETSSNIQSLSRSWNKRTQSWLEQYVYNRTEQSLLTTYTVSALWHGLYPGYFLFFLSAALMSSTERLIRKKINPLILTSPSNPFYHTKSNKMIRGFYTLFCWFITSITLTYHAQTFYMKTFSRSIQAFQSFYYIPNITFFLFYCILHFAPTPTILKIINAKENNNDNDDNIEKINMNKTENEDKDEIEIHNNKNDKIDENEDVIHTFKKVKSL